MEYDSALTNATLYDGTGNPGYKASVGITHGKIMRITKDPVRAKTIIDCEGLVVCPGFIDMHSHSDLVPLTDSLVKRKTSSEKVMQGITTEVNGNCSYSPAPVSEEYRELLRDFMEPLGHFNYEITWKSYGDFLNAVEKARPATNFVGLVGHGTLRVAAMGMKDRVASDQELDKMKALLADGLRDGAFGMSTGLLYTPGIYADKHELIELSRVVAAHRRIVTSHLRDYGNNLEKSIDEALEWVRVTGVGLQISHCMAVGPANWGRVTEAATMIEKAAAEGYDVAYDQYPYTAGMTDLRATVPPWMNEGGSESMKLRLNNTKDRERAARDMTEGTEGWESVSKRIGWNNVVIGFCDIKKQLEGKSIAQISKELGTSEADTVFDLLLSEPTSPLVVIHMVNENDLKFLMKRPLQMFGTDGIPTTGKTHPRTLGSYPRILRKYVLVEKNLTMQDAIRRMTSFPASRVGLRDRGLIEEGFMADIVVFDPKTITDKGTYDNPNQYPQGINYVFVNGVPAVANSEFQETYAGTVIRAG